MGIIFYNLLLSLEERHQTELHGSRNVTYRIPSSTESQKLEMNSTPLVLTTANPVYVTGVEVTTTVVPSFRLALLFPSPDDMTPVLSIIHSTQDHVIRPLHPDQHKMIRSQETPSTSLSPWHEYTPTNLTLDRWASLLNKLSPLINEALNTKQWGSHFTVVWVIRILINFLQYYISFRRNEEKSQQQVMLNT